MQSHKRIIESVALDIDYQADFKSCVKQRRWSERLVVTIVIGFPMATIVVKK